jgi:hypothetical protein
MRSILFGVHILFISRKVKFLINFEFFQFYYKKDFEGINILKCLLITITLKEDVNKNIMSFIKFKF